VNSAAPPNANLRASFASVALRFIVYVGWVVIAGAYTLMTRAWFQSHGSESEFMWGLMVLVPPVGLCSLAYGTYVHSCRHRLRRWEAVTSWVIVALGAAPFFILMAAALADSAGVLRAIAIALGLAGLAIGMAAMPGYSSGGGDTPLAGVNTSRLRLSGALSAAALVVWVVAVLV
jgi:hypothetical protein